jgi:hypothetical protein
MRAFTLVLSGLLGCFATAGGGSDDGTWRPAGRIEFEVYEAPVCGDAGASPLGSCSRERYTGGLEGSGDTAVQSMEPVPPAGVFSITENELLRLADGTLTTRVNAVFNSKSPEREVISFHTITGGTGRYAGASGYIRLWGHAGRDDYEYAALIRLAD